MLGLVFFAALTGLTAQAARGKRGSYVGLIVIGLLLAVADTTAHLPELIASKPWQSGWPSTAFSLGLILSGLATAAVSYAAYRSERQEEL